jgi:hypothetical protein
MDQGLETACKKEMNMAQRPHLTQKVLVAYAVQDTKWLQQLETALTEIFIHWERWNVADGPLPSHADLVILLVSADLMETLPVEQQEVLRERHQSGICCIVGIMLRPVFWYQRPLEVIPVLPPDAFGGFKPLTQWKERNLPFALKRVREGILEIQEGLEQAQLQQMQDFLQEVSNANHHRMNELIEQGLAERLFAMCERFQVAVPPEMVAPLYIYLAEVTSERDPQFAKRCLQQAEAIRSSVDE